MKPDGGSRGTLPYAATTLSSAASSASAVAARRPRPGLIVGVIAVTAGSAIGGALALHFEPATEPPSASPPTSVAVSASAVSSAGTATASAVVTGSTGTDRSTTAVGASSAAAGAPRPERAAGGSAGDAAALPVERRPVLIAQIKDALVRFVGWASVHPAGRDARCPDAEAIGAAAYDPWGQPLRIVCADQPADQIAGVHSYGPDGLPGTADDVVSWELGADVTDLVRGRRWLAGDRRAISRRGDATGARDGRGRRPPATPAPHAPPSATPAPHAPAPAGEAGSDDIDNDGIPDRR